MLRTDLRNIAIIAHVDHGKTTLVDEMLKQGGAFRENQAVQDRVMDNNAIERERGITILAKNTSVRYKDIKINIIDTPGHADFGGEVERVLKMVDGVLLLVDAFEGPMPQTRFVLQKALELGHKVIVVVNKVDRPDARPLEVVDEVLELLLDLDATEEQIESPVIFCSGRQGTASLAPDDAGSDLIPLFETILSHIDPPEYQEGPTKVLVSSIDYNDYVGRIAIGRIERGSLRQNQEVAVTDYHNPEISYKAKIVSMYQFEGLQRVPAAEAKGGDIVSFSGIAGFNIGNTVCDPAAVEAAPFVKISEPTVEMIFSVNDSPFAGREGYELQVGPPKVLYKTVDGVRCEPIEQLVVDIPEDALGAVMEKMGSRKAEMTHMTPQGSRVRLEFLVPSRGLFGYRNEFLTDTRGEGIMNTIFHGYEPYKGDIARRSTGSLIAFENGEAVTYGLYNAQERGTLFISPGTQVYGGMVVGYSPKSQDLDVNVCKKKHVTNMRASGSDEALRLTPPTVLSLDASLEFLSDDELLEVTPQSLRIRKRVLDRAQRLREASKSKN